MSYASAGNSGLKTTYHKGSGFRVQGSRLKALKPKKTHWKIELDAGWNCKRAAIGNTSSI
jgi:hypothetical protein